MNKCFYCPSEETTYCTLCKEWFCSSCRKRYDKRIISMIKKKIPGWLTRKEIDDKKKQL